MIIIDGSLGEGGGQIFRTSLTLSMCLGVPVTIEKIRAGRNKPGLLRQHLTCLRAAKEICNAEICGDEMGSEKVVFHPNEVCAGEYSFSIGSAGSTTLVLQTILIPLLLADSPSKVSISGGTHNGHAPSVEFIKKSFIPIMKKMGYELEIELESYGFYPAGGGLINIVINPLLKKQRLSLSERGEFINVNATAISARLPFHVINREIEVIERETDWNKSDLTLKKVDSEGPGNVVSIEVNYEHITEVFECIGEKNISAEKVAKRAIGRAKHYIRSDYVVGEYLSDQILLGMIFSSGGSFVTQEPSSHTLTNLAVIEKICSISIDVNKIKDSLWLINID